AAPAGTSPSGTATPATAEAAGATAAGAPTGGSGTSPPAGACGSLARPRDRGPVGHHRRVRAGTPRTGGTGTGTAGSGLPAPRATGAGHALLRRGRVVARTRRAVAAPPPGPDIRPPALGRGRGADP